MFEQIDQMTNGIMLRETAEANRYMDDSTSLTMAMFESGVDKKANQVEQVELLGQMKYFEDNVININILNWFYAAIARVSLNTRDLAGAVMYAKAGIELCEKNDDSEGVTANRVVLLDSACSLGAFKTAVKMIEAHPDVDPSGLLEVFRQRRSQMDVELQALLELNSRPLSLKYCMDKQLCEDETKIRFIMAQMHVSRKTAKKYAEEAKAMQGKL